MRLSTVDPRRLADHRPSWTTPYRRLVRGAAGDRDDGRHAVGIEAGDGRGVGAEDVCDLLHDGREHLGRWHPAGDQRGDPAKRRLFLGEPAEFVTTFLELGAARRVRHRGPDELGEVRYALFGVGREALATGPGADRAPHATLDDDGRCDHRPDSQPREWSP
ncbi:MAG: hypothetical protein JWP64_402 [Pseudonocardia sp.]|nr:hypothetical protein [Pseudonocardia sp.]